MRYAHLWILLRYLSVPSVFLLFGLYFFFIKKKKKKVREKGELGPQVEPSADLNYTFPFSKFLIFHFSLFFSDPIFFRFLSVSIVILFSFFFLPFILMRDDR